MSGTVTTPIFCCGFECQVSVGANSTVSHFGVPTATGVSYSTSIFNAAGGGATSILIDNTGTAASANRTHPVVAGIRTMVARFYLRIATDASGNQILFQAGHVTNACNLVLRPGRILRISLGATNSADSAALNLDQWYRIDIKFETSTGTVFGDYSIDGVAQAGTSVAQAAADLTGVTIGTVGAATYKCYFDDLVVSTTAADYPIGDGGVIGYVPTSCGTHSFTAGDFQNDASSNITIGETTSWAKVDEMPPVNTDFIKQVVIRSTGYVEYVYPTPAKVPRAVEHIVYIHNVSTSGNTQKAQLYDGTGAADSYAAFSSGSVAGTIRSGRGHYATAPSGGAWTTTKFENLRVRWGFATDITTNPALDATIIEAEFPLPVTGTGAISASAPTVAGTAVETFTGTGAITGQAPTVAGTGTHSAAGVTGTGAITAGAPAVAGTGAEILTGTSAVTGQAPIVSGTGSALLPVTGTGAVMGTAPAVAGTGAEILTGTGAVTGVAPTVVGTGQHSLGMTGTGAIAGSAPTVVGTGAVVITGTGAIAGAAPTVVGTGAERFTGTGAIAGNAPTVVGTGAERFTGTGAVVGNAPTVVGTGAERFTGTGAIASNAPTVVGTGTHVINVTGTGAVAGAAPAVAGTGAEIFTATGAIAGNAPTVVGTGSSLTGVVGTGTVAGTAPTVVGTGTVTPPAVTGTGVVTGTAPTVAATGAEIFTGTGAAVGRSPTVAGTGTSLMGITGTGAIAGQAATVSGTGTQTLAGITGTGAVVSTAPLVAGTGAERFVATGAVLGAAPAVSGAGFTDAVGTGVLAALAPVVAGSGYVTLPWDVLVFGQTRPGGFVSTQPAFGQSTVAEEAPRQVHPAFAHTRKEW